MGQRHAERLPYGLRGRGGAEELTTAPGGSAGAASQIRRFLQRDQSMRKTRSNCLDSPRVFSLFWRQCHAAGNEDAWKITYSRERHHHGGEALFPNPKSQ